MAHEQKVQEALVRLAAREAGQEGGIKELQNITAEFEGQLAAGGGSMKLLSTADTIPMWNSSSGRMSPILTDQIEFQLSKRFPKHHPMAGQRVYSLEPIQMPEAQELKCWLHEDHELRPWLNEIGLQGRTCELKTIPTEYAVMVHLRRKHSTAYDLIMDARARKREAEEKERQQASLEALQAIAGNRTPEDVPEVFHCRNNGCPRFFDSEDARKRHEGSGHKKVPVG